MKTDYWNAFALIFSSGSTGDHLLGTSREMQKKKCGEKKIKDGHWSLERNSHMSHCGCNALGLGLTSIVRPLVVMKVTPASTWTQCSTQHGSGQTLGEALALSDSHHQLKSLSPNSGRMSKQSCKPLRERKKKISPWSNKGNQLFSPKKPSGRKTSMVVHKSQLMEGVWLAFWLIFSITPISFLLIVVIHSSHLFCGSHLLSALFASQPQRAAVQT